MADSVFQIGKAFIQHGKENDRVYIMKMGDEDVPGLLKKVDFLVRKNGYGKVFAKVPCRRWMSVFIEHGYTTEALVPYFFCGSEDCHFMAKYYDPGRSVEPDQKKIADVISLARNKTSSPLETLPEGLTLRVCTRNDSAEMAKLYSDVFASYPFPIQDKDYLEATMDSDVEYFGIWSNDTGKPVALASAEQDIAAANVEMTDFVTLSSYRNQGLARFLLKTMEAHMKRKNISTAYTIARATSVGMNKTFAGSGYMFGGTLIRNTQICGKLESMNVWHKRL